jgi:hypothetical protein
MQLLLFVANVGVVAILAILSAFYNFMGWQFAVGALFGAALTHVTLRLHYGRWL